MVGPFIALSGDQAVMGSKNKNSSFVVAMGTAEAVALDGVRQPSRLKVMKFWPYVLILLTGLGLSAGVHLKYRDDIATDLARYRAESSENSKEVASSVEQVFTQMYQGLRTIARLPTVRGIDRYAEQISPEGRQTIQEIYNNLASNVAMSEVYIVPVDLEPDRVDQRTGKLQEPITTFDELIVGRHAEHTENHKSSDSEIPEIEIFEYRLMKQQLAWLKSHYPREENVVGVKYPALSGPEVITCDNTRYKPSAPNDKDRSGLVYSVPFYGEDGVLKGCVSGVILTYAISDLLPKGSYALRNTDYDYTIPPHQIETQQTSKSWLRSATPDPALLESRTLELKAEDEGAIGFFGAAVRMRNFGHCPPWLPRNNSRLVLTLPFLSLRSVSASSHFSSCAIVD